MSIIDRAWTCINRWKRRGYDGQSAIFEEIMKMVSQWQPIETAPKDGLYDILVSEGLGVYMATWSRLGPLPNTKFGWITNTNFQVDPTHWMPLPETPK